MTTLALPLERVRCNNCGSDEATVVARGRDHEYPETSDDEFTMVRCRCGLVYLQPRPAESALDRIYPQRYYAYALAEKRRNARGGDSLLARWMERRLVERLRPYADEVLSRAPGASLSILDVGCGDGAMLDQWRKAFAPREVTTHGIELSASAAAFARERGHDVTSARIEDASLPSASFDLAYSFHVIEHVTDPRAFLAKMRDAVRPTGMVLIETPNVDTPEFRFFGDHAWGAYHFPRHFNLYDRATFTRLATEVGLRVERVEYVPSAIHWVWTMHALFARVNAKAADALFPPVDIFSRGSLWNVALLSGFTLLDQLQIAVAKRSSVMRIILRRE